MGYYSIGALVAYGLVCVGARAWLHHRRTGRSPFLSGRADGRLAVFGFGVVLAAPAVLDTAHVLPRLLHGPVVTGAAATFAAVGTVGTWWAAIAMGESWRIGIDDDERTALVTAGPYRWVRNPIYAAMILFALGTAGLTPNAAAAVAVVVVILAFEFVVRTVEEPYLRSTHPEEFLEWARSAGRFLPRTGRARIGAQP